MQRALMRRGRDARLVSLPPFATGDVRQMAIFLDRSIELVRSETNAQKVDLVGVSLGGLIALWWLRRLAGYKRARRLVTVGTPFLGTPFARVGVGLLGWAGAGASQCLPDSDLIQSLSGGSPIPATSMSAEGDRIAPPDRCVLEGAENVVLPGPAVSLFAHQWLILHRQTIDRVDLALD
jgi:hypothetical protein